MKRLLYIVTAVLCIACQAEPDVEMTLHECGSMPMIRVAATCFVVDGKAYLFGGRDERDSLTNDLWRYTPETDSWEDLGATPLMPRVNATSCVAGEKVFIGLGFGGTISDYFDKSTYLRDWWEYTPSSNTWRPLASYPNINTDGATSFVGDGELYVGYGFGDRYVRDMFRYSIATDRWDSIDVNVSFHGYPKRSFGGTGCTCQGRHFMGTGFYRFSLDWWSELVDGTHWEKRSAVPGLMRTLAASTATDQAIYVCGGMHYGGVNTTGKVLQDVRRYDPRTDEWHYVAVLPEGVFNHCCFAIGKRVYIAGGETDKTPNWPKTDRLYFIIER